MSKNSQWSLLGERRFLPFFATQALGAFNDNVFKNALIILIAYQAADAATGESDWLVNLAAALFILPYFMFSATVGQLADKFEKSRLIRGVKLAEIIIMGLAAIGFWLDSAAVLLGVLFLMGTQSTVFSPVKYGYLAQRLADGELVGGNALVEMSTYLTILLGTLVGGVLIAIAGSGKLWVAGTVMFVAVAGYLASRAIPRTPASAPRLRINWNPVTETGRNLRFLTTNRTVFLSVLGISWFWFYGTVYLTQLPNFTRLTLGGDESVVTALLALFSIGVGAGSLLCERLSGDRVELGLVPFGSIGLTIFAIDLFLARPGTASGDLVGAMAFIGEPGNWRVVADIVLIGVFGGFYSVPLYALVQQRCAPDHRSRVIAGNSIVNAAFMVVASVFAGGLLSAGLSIPQLFAVTAALNAAVAIYIYTLVPEFLMRFLVWMLIHTLYRVRKEGLERIPDEGPALLVCNHVSLVDALIIIGCVRRPVRFVMYYRIYRLPILRFIFRTAGAIPIASAKEDPELLRRAYEEIDAALVRGELVCIFPEGQLTVDGEIGEFKSGVERIIERRPVPVIPMALRGLWGSFFSHRHGRPLRGLPRRLFSRIGLITGAAVAPEKVSARELETTVLELRGDIA